MEKTKEALRTLLKVGMKVVNAIEDDGKVDMGEAIGISISAVGIVGIFKDLPAIGAEIGKITPADIKELVDEFNADFDLPNDITEAKIEAGVAALSGMVIMLLQQKAA